MQVGLQIGIIPSVMQIINLGDFGPYKFIDEQFVCKPRDASRFKYFCEIVNLQINWKIMLCIH